MSYETIKHVLPKELIEQIQNYVDGKVIYIPKKKEHKQRWGENTDTREFLAKRNQAIYDDFKKGMSLVALSEKYYLNSKSIQRILKQVS